MGPIAPRQFKATAFNHLSYAVADYARSRDFYVDLLGMKPVYDDGTKCSVEFGDPPNALYLVNVKNPGGSTGVGHFAISIANFDREVEVALKCRGLNPEYDGDYAWTVHDPDGYILQIGAEWGVFPGAALPGAKQSDGNKNMALIPPPSGKGFKAIAVHHISYGVADYARTRDFYADLLGMKVTRDTRSECYLTFGNPQNAILVRRSQQPGNKPFVDHFAVTIRDFEKDAVHAELKRRGLDPQPDSKWGWTIHDPDGYRVQICGSEMLR